MKIKVTNVFADFINANCANLSARVIKLSQSNYAWTVGDPCENEVDYDFKTGYFKAIEITYPANCYAVPQYLTTGLLCKEFRRRNIRDVSGLIKMLQDMLYI